jgi:predicted short-subunit dehydrogenase-like oxidoreductase (DUF2520 family)
MPEKEITIIGSGNVATNLALVFNEKTDVQIHIHGRSEVHAKFLADKIGASFSAKVEDIPYDSDMYILSVSDDAISELVVNQTLKEQVNNNLFVHTSGSVSMDVLESLSHNYGVFYPLQTFSKFKALDFKNIPICLEASSGFNYDKLTKYALKLSDDIRRIDSERRKYLHLAAVFANNFSNNLFAVAEQILSDHQIDFSILLPLIHETIKKIEKNKPSKVQTGPAFRNDQKTMSKHIELLNNNILLKELYQLLSKNIQEFK